MSSYNMECFLKDFCERTTINLELINAIANNLNVELSNKRAKAYEVTQLLNSLFGLLIVPSEIFNGKDENKEYNIKKYDEYANIKKIINKSKLNGNLYNDFPNQCKYPVGDFINHMRNSLAHSGRIHFYPISSFEHKDELQYVIFYDTNEKYCKTPSEVNKFCLKLSIEDIKELALAISKLYVKLEGDTINSNNNYVKEIQELEVLLKNE